MGLFSKRRAAEPAPSAGLREAWTPSVVNPVTGKARVGDTGYPIVPVLRRREWIREIADKIPDASSRPIITDLDRDVVVCYAFDTPTTFHYVTPALAAEAGVEAPDVVGEARAWLGQSLKRAQFAGNGGRYRVTVPGQDDMAAALILCVPDWLNRIAIEGEPVIAIGTRVMMHVCGSKDVDSIAGLRRLSQDLYDLADGQPLTPALFTIDEAGNPIHLD